MDTATLKENNWSVFGHEWAVRLLKRAMLETSGDGGQSNNLRHAYLLLGPRQVGKSTLAKAWAEALLCSDNDHAPCGLCRACRLMAQGNHPDFCLVQPTDKNGDVDRENGTLRAEQAGTIIRDVATRPLEGRIKFFLIQDFQRANDSFANKLLKTLEEPPEHALLCLTATDKSSVLPTIVSRCQILELRPLDQPTLAQALATGWSTEAPTSELLAKLSGGRLGWAADQLQQADGLLKRSEDIATLVHLIRADRVERLAYAETLAGQRNSQTLFNLLELWTSWWRDILLVQAGSSVACSNVDHLPELQRLAEQLASPAVRSYIYTLKRIEGYLHHTVNTRLALDVLLLQMPMPLQAKVLFAGSDAP